MKIITVIGARPQFIKASVVSRELRERIGVEEKIVHTGQHFDKNMSDVFFDEMQIPRPDYFLGINQLSHGAMTGRMLEGIEEILMDERPDWVLVYGDTNSTLAGALAAKKLHYKVAHVEAGLRSFNMLMPEEINRIVTDRLSDILFCPTAKAVKNLELEGFKNFNNLIVRTGDIMYDAAVCYSSISSQYSSVIKKYGLNKFVVCTIHREENTDNIANFKSIIAAINKITDEMPVFMPLHPRAKKIMDEHGIITSATIAEPVGYLDMIELLKHCGLVITDSGGLQKEAFFYRKCCVTLREQTEWTELVDGGFNITTGANSSKIYDGFKKMINHHPDFNTKLYGNAHAAKEIADTLLR